MSSEPQQDRKPDNKKLLTVEQCENWKARVHQEKVAAKEAPTKWVDYYGDIHKHLPADELKKHEEYLSKLAQRQKAEEGSALWSGVKADELMMEVKASPPIPQSTSGRIGWRSGNDYNYVMNDVHDSKHYQHDLVKTLKWPMEGCP